MFEVGKLCDESLDSFLSELEKVSLLDAEGEGEVSRYFAHAVMICSVARFKCYFALNRVNLCDFLDLGDSTFNNYCLEKCHRSRN